MIARFKIFFAVVIITPFIFGLPSAANAVSLPSSEIGLEDIQKPLQNLVQDATPDFNWASSTDNWEYVERGKAFWNNTDAWLKDKLGISLTELLAQIGSIITFVLKLIVRMIESVIGVIQFLLSLIPKG